VISVNVSTKVGSKTKQLREIATDGLITNDDMDQIARLAIFNEIDRTTRGLDVELTQFAPYSDEYAKLRSRFGLTSDKVTLSFSENLLNSLTFEVFELAGSNKLALIFFDAAEKADLARWHIEGVEENNLPSRDFHGVDEGTLDDIVDLVKALIADRLEALDRG
jgi:hypothetical protein